MTGLFTMITEKMYLYIPWHIFRNHLIPYVAHCFINWHSGNAEPGFPINVKVKRLPNGVQNTSEANDEKEEWNIFLLSMVSASLKKIHIISVISNM